MNRMNPQVDAYLAQAPQWQEEMERLRAILLDCPLTEEFKWGKPCYTFQNSNVVIIQGFKEYCAILFFKGALLEDAHGVLVQPGKNTQAGRQIRFTDLREIVEMEPIVRAYVEEALQVEQAGLKVELRQTAELVIPEEFQRKLDELPALKTAFEGLTPGRQRAYILHFSGAKQSKTRASRVEKQIQRILDGMGLNDR